MRQLIPPRLPVTDDELLAGLSFMTVLNLKHAADEELDVTSAGPDAHGHYSGWIVTPDGRPVIHSPNYFASGKAAEDHMRRIWAAAKRYERPQCV